LRIQMDFGVRVNLIRKVIGYTLSLQTVILTTTALPKSLNTTDANTN
jgi:hypothetical protein